MKRRSARAPMKSQLLAKDASMFDAADRDAFEKLQQRGGDVAPGWVSRWNYRRLIGTIIRVNGIEVPGIMVSTAAKIVRDRYPDTWKGNESAALDNVWRVIAAVYAIIDNTPNDDDLTEDQERALAEQVKERAMRVLDSVELYAIDPDPHGEYRIETNDSGESFDLSGIIEDVRAKAKEFEERGVETLDEYYLGKVLDGGRKYARAAIVYHRSVGDLPKLRATDLRVRLVNREQYERVEQTRYSCCCGDGSCERGEVRPTPWEELEDQVEDGRIALMEREEETQDRKMVQILFHGAPSKVEDYKHWVLEHRDPECGLEVR
jgi:hypothetical protein